MKSIKLERNFVNEKLISKYLKCIICEGVYNEPVRVKCGHTFCKICISQWINDHQNCPECRSNIKKKNFQTDRIAAGILGELDVYCSDKKYGCKWKGVLDRLEVHQQKCTAKIVAEQPNLQLSQNQDVDEENELAQQNNPSNENSKNNNLDKDDPYSDGNALSLKRKIDQSEEDLPKQQRKRHIQQQNK
ncbi:unnamed protein product [Paramecium sonneborni]|uniref:RING-type domain-containing protein n=1 Tax=Paramecium sonneborni TaxID=65129 RepID=A0A8S1NMV7_9CILI|nr:unnamed protein product [Paramecium sonneborni]